MRLILFLIFWIPSILAAAEPLVIQGYQLDADGFPTGQNTPEGVAADFARAFISKNYTLFEAICIPPYGRQSVRDRYKIYRDEVKEMMDREAVKPTPSRGGPAQVGKVFAARHLSQTMAAIYGKLSYGFEDVQFVDVGVVLVSGDRVLNRTMVIKKDGKWYVHPMPELSPTLSDGLNKESASTQDYSEKDATAK